MKKIHWLSTAKQDELFVREFENTNNSDSWFVIVDLDADVQFGSGLDSSSERGIILAASLATQGLRKGKPVGLAVHGNDKLVFHPPRNGQRQLTQLLSSLAVVEEGSSKFQKLLENISPRLNRQTSLILITPERISALQLSAAAVAAAEQVCHSLTGCLQMPESRPTCLTGSARD